MLSPNLEKFIDAYYASVKSDYPDLSEFHVKSVILAAVRAYGSELADTMVAVHVLGEQVKALAVLAQYS